MRAYIDNQFVDIEDFPIEEEIKNNNVSVLSRIEAIENVIAEIALQQIEEGNNV